MQYPNNSKIQIYCDEFYKLVDCLGLLIASHQTEHSNHNNEIVSAIEELQESGVNV